MTTRNKPAGIPAREDPMRPAHREKGRPRERHRGAVGRTLVLSVVATTATGGVLATQAGAATHASPNDHASASDVMTGGHVVLTDATMPTYTVRFGDTLSALALRFGTTVAALAAANRIADPNLIYAGQTLVISSGASQPTAPVAVSEVPASSSYTVRLGDTLSVIALRFGTTVAALAAANRIADPNLIYAGQVLVISGASARPPVVAASPTPAPAVAQPAPVSTPSVSTASAGTLLSGESPSVQAMFACIVQKESGGNPEAYNSASGAMGLLQFMEGTWLGNGGARYAQTPLQASAQEQMNIGVVTYERDGWQPWSTDPCF